jgi:Putative adhesin
MLRLLVAALACATFTYAVDTEDHVRKSVPVSSAIRLTLAAEVGSIRIQPGSGKNVDVDVYFRGIPPSRGEFDRMLGDFTLDVAQQGTDIRVNAIFHDGWRPQLFFWRFGLSHPICRNFQCLEYSSWLREVDIRVTVPQQFSVDLATSGNRISVEDLKGEVNARTSGGSLNFSRIEGSVDGRTSGGSITLAGGKGRAVVRTSGGSIRITDVAGDVDASTSGGSISMDRVSGRVSAHTSGGGISLHEAAGAIEASTSGGAVTASLLGQPRENCHLSTSGGSITVSVPKDVRMDLDASTSGGRVSTDFPVPNTGDRYQRRLRAPLNGGGPLLYLHTSGGGISVRRAG